MCLGLTKMIYRAVRPALAASYRYMFGSRVVTWTDLIGDSPPEWTVYRFGSDEYYEFTEPRHVGKLPEAIEAKLGDWNLSAPFVVELSDAAMIGPSGLVTRNDKILLESVRGSYQRLVDTSIRTLLAGQLPAPTRLQSPDRRYSRPAFSFVGPWAFEYYHWLTDYLVRVFALETYRERTGSDPVLLLPPDPSTWMLDSLRFAGVDIDHAVEWTGGRARFDRLAVGSVRFHTISGQAGYVHSPAGMARLGDRIRTAVDGTEGDPTRLYVSRADAPKRRVLNEEELVSRLEPYGFERFVPGEHSFAEQVRRFSNVELILGPHGAGLTNVIFAEKTTLVELFGAYRNACYFALSQGMTHDYASVTCCADGADLIVDVDAVSSLLDDLLAEND